MESQSHKRGNQGGRSRGRGRGGRGRGKGGTATSGNQDPSSSNKTPPDAIDPGGGEINTNQTNLKSQEASEAEEKSDSEVCFICASDVIHTAVAPCNHRTCHICSIRMRALYKTKACAHCRTESDFVIFTDERTKRFEDFTDDDFTRVDDELGIKYEKPEIYEDTVLLLRYNCPDESCDVACLGWPDLDRHVKSIHKKVMCDLCTRNKKVFTHEHDLFTYPELRKHQKFGDDNPGAVDQSGFKGHPECGFCRERFYGDDELYAHCREKHERCHICDRRSQGNKPSYFQNYDDLELHFRKDHFLCPDQECLEKKFVVFESEMDLQAHQVEAHPSGLSKDALKGARRVDLSNFQLREQYQPQRGGSSRGQGQGRGRSRGRDPNTDPLPASSAQPLRRDELAFQRQQAIHSTTSSGRTFGTHLTRTSQRETFAAVPPANVSSPPVQPAQRSLPNGDFPSLSSLQSSIPASPPTTTSPRPSASTSPQDPARQVRHAAVTQRASTLLRDDSTKLDTFRSRISAYHNSTLSASELIDGFFTLFDGASNAELGIVIKELAELFEPPPADKPSASGAEKRGALLRAWRDWKAINEDYPTLPGAPSPSGSGAAPRWGAPLAPTPATAPSARVLRLKSSTARSGRSAAGRAASWGSSALPSLPAPSRLPSSTPAPSSTPWAAPAPASARPAPQRPRAPLADADAFPCLPAAPPAFTPAFAGPGVRRGGGAAVGRAWGARPERETPEGEGEGEGETGGKRKGKGKGKQAKKITVMHFG